MKIYLDLLPQQRKQEIKRKKLFLKILREEALFLLPIVVFVVILLNVYYLLTVQKDNTIAIYSAQQSQNKYQQLGTYEEKFKQVNLFVQTLKKIQAGHLHWQELFQQLSDTIPGGIYISDLSTKNYNVFLVGKAQSRDDLLDLKSKLEANPCFQNVNVPLSNLVVKNDVDFQIDLSIKEDCLKKQQ
jgi:Tfp pilus assembly protein PilN